MPTFFMIAFTDDGAKVLTFVARKDEQDYLLHKNIAANMDLTDFIPGSFNKELVGEVLQDTFVASLDGSMKVNPIIVIGEDAKSPSLHSDDSPKKCILVPLGNVIFPTSWTSKMPIDMFLFVSVYPYIVKLVHNNLTVIEFVLANPIGQLRLSLEGHNYKSLYGYAKLNKLVDI